MRRKARFCIAQGFSGNTRRRTHRNASGHTITQSNVGALSWNRSHETEKTTPDMFRWDRTCLVEVDRPTFSEKKKKT